MNRRLISVFAFALAVASITSFLVYRLIVLRVQAPAARPVSNSKIVVAAHDLQIGSLLHDNDLEDVSWNGPTPPGALSSKDTLVGRGVVETIYQSEPVLEKRLASKGAGAGLAATIPVGKRAVALRVNEVVGLAGFVLPGMRVDVLVAGNVPGQEGTWCRTVLQNIEVLSAGQKIEKSADGKPESAQVVNLLVTPDQAEILNLASSETKVQLVLRNPMDTQEEITRGSSLAGLFGQPNYRAPSSFAQQNAPPAVQRPTSPPAAAKPVKHESDLPVIEVFSGNKRTEQQLTPSKEDK